MCGCASNFKVSNSFRLRYFATKFKTFAEVDSRTSRGLRQILHGAPKTGWITRIRYSSCTAVVRLLQHRVKPTLARYIHGSRTSLK